MKTSKMEEIKIAELAEKYLNNQMSETEKELFLLVVRSNTDYSDQFDQYKKLFDTFAHMAIKEKINEAISGVITSYSIHYTKLYESPAFNSGMSSSFEV